MKTSFEMDGLKTELEALGANTNDKISRSTVRKWILSSWISIMMYLMANLVKSSLKKNNKIQTIKTSITSAIANYLNYRIIQELGLTNDEANTKFDQVMVKYIGRIYTAFREELNFVDKLRKDLTINLEDNAGFIAVVANLIVTAKDDKDILYNQDLKERRFFCVVKREHSHIKYEKGNTISEIKAKYPDTNVEIVGLTPDVPQNDIVVFDDMDKFYRSLPADMSHGLKDMDGSGEFTLITISDQKALTGDSIPFYLCRNSNSKDYQEAAEKIAKNGIYNILDKQIVDDMNKKITTTPTMSNSLIVWDGHPSTFKLGSESNFQLISYRHIDFDQTITKSIKENKFASAFINNLIQISTGDNMFNVQGSIDRMREGMTKDQKVLRESDVEFVPLVKKTPDLSTECILTDGDVNITSQTEKSMRINLGTVMINSTHSMEKGNVVTKFITRQVAFIKLKPEHDYTVADFQILNEMKVPKITRTYYEEEQSREHSFYIEDSEFETAAKHVLIDNKRTEGPISNIASVISVKDLVSRAFGTVPPLLMMNVDESDLKLAGNTFYPFNIKERRIHVNAGCIHAEDLDASSVIKYYGNCKTYASLMDDIMVEMLNRKSLVSHPTDFEYVREYKPLEYQTFNAAINNTTEVFKTRLLRDNRYATLLKLPRAEIHSLIYTYESVELSVICNSGYKGASDIIIRAMEYNPYFYTMLGMKFDIDSRFSNENIAVWDNYLSMLSPYSNLEKLVIHHFIMEASSQKILDTINGDDGTESELTKRKNKHLQELKNRSAYYEAAIQQVTDDLDDGKLDENKNYIVQDVTLSESESLLQEAKKNNEDLNLEKSDLETKISKQKREITNLKTKLTKANKGGK